LREHEEKRERMPATSSSVRQRRFRAIRERYVTPATISGHDP
jgi:hypothetical protein